MTSLVGIELFVGLIPVIVLILIVVVRPAHARHAEHHEHGEPLAGPHRRPARGAKHKAKPRLNNA